MVACVALVRRPPCYNGSPRNEWKQELASSLHSSAKQDEHGGGGYVKALWNKWEGPGSAGRESVYAAKGLDISSKTDGP